jgi:death-on-curing protein
MRYLTLKEALELHSLIIEQSGGSNGVRDFGLLESAVAQPLMTFDGVDLYPTLVEKAAALCFSVVSNHPFIDGNKRVGHAVMETFLLLNGCEINSSVTEQEKIILSLAAGDCERAEFVEWLRNRIIQVK